MHASVLRWTLALTTTVVVVVYLTRRRRRHRSSSLAQEERDALSGARFHLYRQANASQPPPASLSTIGAGVSTSPGTDVILVHETSEFRLLASELPARGELRPTLVLDIGSAYGHTTEILAGALGDPIRVIG